MVKFYVNYCVNLFMTFTKFDYAFPQMGILSMFKKKILPPPLAVVFQIYTVDNKAKTSQQDRLFLALSRNGVLAKI